MFDPTWNFFESNKMFVIIDCVSHGATKKAKGVFKRMVHHLKIYINIHILQHFSILNT